VALEQGLRAAYLARMDKGLTWAAAPLSLAAVTAACTIPGGSAWSDLHVNAFGSAYGAGLESSGTDITVDDVSSASLDFEGDLQINRNTETVLYYGARLGFAPFELSASRFGYDGSNDGVVSAATRFAGVPITGSLDVTTEIDLSVSKLLAGLDVLNTPAVRIGVLAGIDLVEFDRFDLIAQEAQVGVGGAGTSVAVGDVQTILENEAAVVPIVGLRGDVLVPFLGRLGGEVTGLKFAFDDADLFYLDWDLAAHWEPWEHVELVVGYRAVMMKIDGAIDGTNLNIDLDVNGPYAGLAVYW